MEKGQGRGRGKGMGWVITFYQQRGLGVEKGIVMLPHDVLLSAVDIRERFHAMGAGKPLLFFQL